MTNTAKSTAVSERQTYGARSGRETKNMTLRKTRFQVLDSTVGEKPYLTGDQFTVADLNLAAVLPRLTVLGGKRFVFAREWHRHCVMPPRLNEHLDCACGLADLALLRIPQLATSARSEYFLRIQK